MKITFYAHASFRLEADGLTVITDPYSPEKSKFDPINETADIVLMSSDTDDFHSDPSHIQGNPEVVNTLGTSDQRLRLRRDGGSIAPRGEKQAFGGRSLGLSAAISALFWISDRLVLMPSASFAPGTGWRARTV